MKGLDQVQNPLKFVWNHSDLVLSQQNCMLAVLTKSEEKRCQRKQAPLKLKFHTFLNKKKCSYGFAFVTQTSSYLLNVGFRIIADNYINTDCYSLSYIYWNLSKASLCFSFIIQMLEHWKNLWLRKN